MLRKNGEVQVFADAAHLPVDPPAGYSANHPRFLAFERSPAKKPRLLTRAEGLMSVANETLLKSFESQAAFHVSSSLSLR